MTLGRAHIFNDKHDLGEEGAKKRQPDASPPSGEGDWQRRRGSASTATARDERASLLSQRGPQEAAARGEPTGAHGAAKRPGGAASGANSTHSLTGNEAGEGRPLLDRAVGPRLRGGAADPSGRRPLHPITAQRMAPHSRDDGLETISLVSVRAFGHEADGISLSSASEGGGGLSSTSSAGDAASTFAMRYGGARGTRSCGGPARAALLRPWTWWRGGRARQRRERSIRINDNFERAERAAIAGAYPVNMTRNQKYSLLTFVPVVLFNQFKYFYNLYFLLIAISQLFERLRVTYMFVSVAPLVFVLLVTMLKEASDDHSRYVRDKAANSQLYTRLTPDGPVEVPSGEIVVGDLILVRKDQRIPADMVLLRTSDKGGTLFVRTDQLDGEIDWKMRTAVGRTQGLPSDYDVFDLDATIVADGPRKDIYNFVGNFSAPRGSHKAGGGGGGGAMNDGSLVESLSIDNAMWMNTVVASGTALGCVIYTGRETRASMNTSFPKTKAGITDLEINKVSKCLGFLTVAISIVMMQLRGWGGNWMTVLVRFIVIFSAIIPISMRVNLDMGKTVCSREIANDRKLRDVIVRTSTLPEELGRVQYLLTDKTGTLTKNDIELKRLHLGTMSYGPDSTDELHSHLASAISSMQAALRGKQQQAGAAAGGGGGGFLRGVLGGGGRSTGSVTSPEAAGVAPSYLPHHRGRRDQSGRIFAAMQALSLCHNVTPIKDDQGQTTYQASSPDEIAIIKWCELVGLCLEHRDRERITIQLTAAGAAERATLNYEILHVFPFTSETKRMGIIVRDAASGEAFFFEKGADVVMSSIVMANDWLEEECTNMAREGLRTLVIARRRLSEEALASFDEAYQEARVSIVGRSEHMQRVVEQHLERDLELLAVTGVEDKLQEDVRGTLEKIRNAGIRIWMLTGDKVETATNIAVSSRLFSRDRRILQFQNLSEDECWGALQTIRRTANCCVVVDGHTLHRMLDGMPQEFLAAVLPLNAIVCCRCTPTQKADVARLIQGYDGGRRVCCIGDGGNDVSMIQAANVGIGVVGKEGLQASLAADFSIPQFNYITRLLVWHGRNSYRRTAKLAMFVIHRGIVISAIQAVFSAIFYFAPISIFQGLLYMGYTTFYTMAPVFSLVLDRDVSEEVAMTYVELYKDLTKGREVTYKVFFKCLMVSTYQGGIIMLMSLIFFEHDFIHIISITFSALILNELLMICLEINTWHYAMVISEVASFFLYIASIFVMKDSFDLEFTFSTTFLIKVTVITVISFLPLAFIHGMKHLLAPTSATKLQR